MTVRQLESALADMPSDAEVRIAIGVFGGLAVQSVERLPEQPGTVWLANELDNDLTPEQAHAIMDRELGAESDSSNDSPLSPPKLPIGGLSPLEEVEARIARIGNPEDPDITLRELGFLIVAFVTDQVAWYQFKQLVGEPNNRPMK